MRLVQPLAQIVGDRDSARLDQRAGMGRAEQPCQLALGVLSFAAHGDIARLPFAAAAVQIKFQAPRVFPAPRNATSAHAAFSAGFGFGSTAERRFSSAFCMK
jgi:hypothetical protein